jgi:hypothetical protein
MLPELKTETVFCLQPLYSIDSPKLLGYQEMRMKVAGKTKLRAGEHSEEDVLTGPGAHAAVAIAQLAGGALNPKEGKAPRYSIRRSCYAKVSDLNGRWRKIFAGPSNLFDVPHYP